MHLKISTQTGSFKKVFDDKKVIDILKEAGFDAVDYSFFNPADYDLSVSEEDYRKRYTELRKYTEDKGLYFNQSHAPHPSSRVDGAFTEKRFDELVCTIKSSSFLGVRNIIIHPVQHLLYHKEGNAEKLFEMNMEFYRKLIPYCEEYGITICTENMWQYYGDSHKIWDSTCSRAEEFIQYVDGVGSPYLKACLDLGHTVLSGENPTRIIKMLGNRIAALHVHDNDGISDSHTLPFHGILDWNAIADALGFIGYNGEITLESEGFMPKTLPADLHLASAVYAAGVAREFAGMVEAANEKYR